jgi:hypothetical protein
VRRSSLASLPKRVGRPLNPALALALGNNNDGVAGVAWTTVTLGTLSVGDGFTLASNALTCLVPGVYEFSVLISGNVSVGAYARVGFRVSGGTDQPFGYIDNTTVRALAFKTFVKLGAGDTLELRIRGDTAGDSIQTYGLSLGNGTRVTLEQISTFQ